MFWYIYGSFDAAFDVVVSVLPIYVVADVQISKGKKLRFAVAFAGRIL